MLVLLAGVPFVHAAEPRLPRDQYKNGQEVRAAYRKIVATASQATVHLSCDGRNVALGAIIDANGGVLTKASQLSGTILCKLHDGREFDARIIGVHEKLDLAYLKIDATDLPTVVWEQGAPPAVGQMLATPGMEDIPIAVGVVSVPRRRLPEQRGMLGITTEELKDGKSGARIMRVLPKSGAEEAGLQIGDVIQNVGGAEVKNIDEVADSIGKHEPGEMIELKVVRGDEKLTVRATLGYPTPDLVTRGGFMNHLGGRLSRRRTGFPPIIQHDTVLSPEECGGPLVSLSGNVVGLNIARAGRTESYALPPDSFLPVLEDLRSGRLAPAKKDEGSASSPAPPPVAEK